ncbi:MAG TPA: TonB-dependent receptor [Thermoanaerobaculia bacterium]|nr:TonB-dependent receptor [Thermoanaerobaculia bacterium]
MLLPAKLRRFSERLLRAPLVALVILAGLGPSSAFAQTPGTGSIRGRVLDETGRPLSGALVAASNASTGIDYKALTDAAGYYALAGLPLTGSYRLEISKDGFAPDTRTFALRAGETATVEAVLHPAGVRSEVTVYGTTEGVRSDSAQLGNRFSPEKIQETPILGRKLTSLPLLDSAVRSARGTGDMFLNNTLFVVDGGGRRQTTYAIDGGTGDDAWGRQTILTNIPLAAIQDFTVITANGSAEYGRTTGAAINLVTKQGTNDLHGDILGIYRPGGLQPNAPVTGFDVADELWQGSGVIGGPLVKDKVYFLLGGEYNDQNRGSEITSPQAPGVYEGEFKQGLAIARLDAQLTDANHLMIRGNMDQFTDSNPADAVGGLNLPSTARTFERRVYTGQVSDNAIFSPDLFNELRAGIEVGSPITQFIPVTPSTQYVRPGVGTSGESRSATLFNHQYYAADTVSWASGAHYFRFGGDLIYSNSGGNGTEFGSPFVLGQFTFKPGISPSVPNEDLTIDDATRFTQGFGQVYYNVRDTIWSVFLQDDWRVLPNLALNVGVRYDRQSLTDDHKQVGPRLGFAWNADKSGKTVVRGAYGIYYSQIQTNTAATWALGGPTGIFTFSAAPGQLGFPTDLAPLPEFPPGATLPPRDITIRPGEAAYYDQFFDVSQLKDYPDALVNPRTQQASLGIEREVAPQLFLSVDGLLARTTRIPRNLDENSPDFFDRTAAGQTRSGAAADATRPITPVPNGYRRILVTISAGHANYDGLQLNLRKNFETKGGMLLSYTWSHTRNDVEPDAPGGDPNDANLLAAEWGDSLLDQRHRVVASGWWTLPWNLLGGGVIQYATPRPYNPTTGVDNNGDGANTDRPVVDGVILGRNSQRGTDTFDLALFLQKDILFSGGFTLSLRAEGFNLTNHANIVGRNGVYGNATDGTPLPSFGAALGGINNVEPVRAFQFQARVAF